MPEPRLDRGPAVIGVILVVLGLMAMAWVFGGGDGPTLADLALVLLPLLAIGLGIVAISTALPRKEASAPTGRRSPDFGAGDPEPVALALDGADRADVRIGFGAGRLHVGRAETGHLVDGSIVGGGVIRDGPGRVRFWSDTPWLEWVPGLQRDWSIGVTGEVPIRMEVQAGAADVELDCRDLRLDELIVRSGASAVRVVASEHGSSRIRTEVGAGSLDVTVPDGVAARIRISAVLGSREIDLGRFPVASGGYETPGFAQAVDRVDIDAQSAIGSLRVR